MQATVEAPIHAGIKQALVKAKETDTALVMRTLKNTERVYKNKVVEQVQVGKTSAPVAKMLFVCQPCSRTRSPSRLDPGWGVPGWCPSAIRCFVLIERRDGTPTGDRGKEPGEH